MFQKTIISKYLKTQNKDNLIIQWDLFCAHFHNPEIQENIRNSKEEQYQEGFLRDLFVKIFGYTLNPTIGFNLTTEYKNIKDSKKADGAIIINDKVIGVIELKGTNTTDLGKVEEQAFNYKNNQTGCRYVITSNFEKLRLYIDDSVRFVEFNLFTLHRDDFNLLYLLLSFENIKNDIPKKLKDESLNQEDIVTKKLYKDYSVFKRELFQNLTLLNPEYDPLLLFQKSQKLLDRLLFLLFGEDRGLLPPNSVRQILEQWDKLKDLDAYDPLYNRYKKYFGYLNTGFKGKNHDVFAYNGGLFKEDEILDQIKIDDDLLYQHTFRLSQYDFASEVDVNILGHIFENSLNEIDEIKAQLEGTEIDKSKTKRKKDGVFYTPKYITKYIVENTVGKLCEEKKTEFQIVEEEYFTDKKRQQKTKENLLAKLDQYRTWLLQITIVDPACGSGAFLNEALNFLIEEHQYVDELEAKLLNVPIIFSYHSERILENNLFGVDLNEESVEIAKLSLWLRTAEPNRKLNSLNDNIKCGNSLIDDPEVAGDKAFHWEKEFPQVFQEKEKKVFHITTAIHDSRTSKRMIDYKVREKRAMGTLLEPQVNYLTDEDEMVIAETMALLKKELNLNILAFNVCRDHMHLVLVCEEIELAEIVRKIKGKTAREVNRNKGINPLVQEKGEPSTPLWTQKFFSKEVRSDEQLKNTVDYVKRNREKHKLPVHRIKGFKTLVDRIASNYEFAFRKEYKGGFDVVIGNPPYVNSKGLNFRKSEKEFYYNNYKTAIYQIDTYILFLEKLKLLLKTEGKGSYIVPNSWLNNLFLKDVRKFILENFFIDEIANTPSGVFSDANVDTIIINLRNVKDINPQIRISSIINNEFVCNHYADQITFCNNTNHTIDIFSNEDTIHLIKKIEFKKNILSEYCKIGRGVGVYHKRVGHTKEFIEKDPYQSKHKLDDSFVPYLRGRNIDFYNFQWSNDSYISYGNWLAEPREDLFFENERIVLRQIPSKTKLLVTYLDQKFIIDQSVFIARFIDKNLSPKYILSILGSKLLFFYFKNKYSEFDDLFPKVKLQHFKDFPILFCSDLLQQPFVEKADLLLSLNKDLQTVSGKLQRNLEREFSLENLSKKLQTWYQLSYDDFLKELKKQKVELTLSQKADWEHYFDQEKNKAVQIQSQITTTDQEIDRMVYELYGLTEEEIAIVEKG